MSGLVWSDILCLVDILGVESAGGTYMFAIFSVCLLMITCVVCNTNVSSCGI